jgi:hypothetical protein
MDDGPRRRMNQTGIGFAGIDGVWWLPAVAPFPLPAALGDELDTIASAIFTFLDAVRNLVDAPEGAALRALLTYRVPEPLAEVASPAPVLMLRPDFQLVVHYDGGLHLVATELEIAPAAQGFADAMQAGYGLPRDLAAAVARLVDGYPLLLAGAAQWSEFLFEQLAFCRALEAHGADARVLYDEPIEAIAASVGAGQRWNPPMFGIRQRPPGWDPDVLGHIRVHGLERYLAPGEGRWPDSVGITRVFRFGYTESYRPEALAALRRWATSGAVFLNPLAHYLESKVLLAALRLPLVRERVEAGSPGTLAILDRAIPETHLLRPENTAAFEAGRAGWVLKYAGFDGDNQAWGGRSLRFGRDLSEAAWAEALRRAAALPWPVVVQRLTPSAVVDASYFDIEGHTRTLTGGTVRLRSFLLRGPEGPRARGSHVTITASAQVSEATDAIQAPVVFT